MPYRYSLEELCLDFSDEYLHEQHVLMEKYGKLHEPHPEKTSFFANAKTKALISCADTTQLTSTFVFAINSIMSLLPKSAIASLYTFLCLCSPVCIRPGRNSQRQAFS